MSAVVRAPHAPTEEDCRHDADQVDPTAPGYGAHLPFHSILQRCGLAWRNFMAGMPLDYAGIIVPNVNADFVSEVGLGELDIDVSLVAVGRTSFTVVCDVSQDGVAAARVTVVLVAFDYAGGVPVPLSEEQREWLGGVVSTGSTSGVSTGSTNSG